MLCWAVCTFSKACAHLAGQCRLQGEMPDKSNELVISPGTYSLPVLLLCFPETASLVADSLNSRFSCLPHVEIEVLCHYISVSAVFRGKA